jgi:hypothetical protein
MRQMRLAAARASRAAGIFVFPSPLRITRTGEKRGGMALEIWGTGGRGSASYCEGGRFPPRLQLQLNFFHRRLVMADVSKDKGFDEILGEIGPDATAMFDNSPSNPTEHASSEATNAATKVDGDDTALEDEDDLAAEEEEDDEEDEEEDVEDEAGV